METRKQEGKTFASQFDVVRFIKITAVLILSLLLWNLPSACFGIPNITVIEQRMISIFAFAALMWITEGVPAWVTSVLIIVVMLFTVSDSSISMLIDLNNYAGAATEVNAKGVEQLQGLIPYKDIIAAFADPTVSGSSYTALCTMIQALPGEPADLIDAFVENLDGCILDSSGLVTGAVAEGSCYIGVTMEETAMKAIKAGYDIAMVYPREGTSDLPDGAAVVKGCAHGENARKFIDFLLSSDVQNRLGNSFCRRSVREGAVVPEGWNQLSLMDYDTSWASRHQTEILSRWAADVGEGMP